MKQLLLKSYTTYCMSFFRILSCRYSNYKWRSFWGEGQMSLIRPKISFAINLDIDSS
jgi:NRPS condensation-like uncharacterized protein